MKVNSFLNSKCCFPKYMPQISPLVLLGNVFKMRLDVQSRNIPSSAQHTGGGNNRHFYKDSNIAERMKAKISHVSTGASIPFICSVK